MRTDERRRKEKQRRMTRIALTTRHATERSGGIVTK
jgi:hypothetical protein